MPMTANILHKWRAQIQLNSTKQHTSPYQISQFISFNSGCTYHESICWLVHMCRKGGAFRVQYPEKFILVSLRGFSAHVFHKMRYSPQLWGCWLVFVAFFGTLNSAKLTILYSTEYEDDRQGRTRKGTSILWYACLWWTTSLPRIVGGPQRNC